MMIKQSFKQYTLPSYEPFDVSYKDLGENIIQIDISGKGLLAYTGKYDRDMEMEIYTNILESFSLYCHVSDINTADIGHHLRLIPTKKYNHFHQAYEYQMEATIIFKSPFVGKRAKALDSTVAILSSNIIDECFIQN